MKSASFTMCRAIVGLALAGLLAACAADRTAPSDCPPATTLSGKTNWQLAVGTYSARQENGVVTVTAKGENRSGGYKVQLAREPLKIFPPRLALYHKPPEGIATQAITPFSVCVSFKAPRPVNEVLLRDGTGEHRVAVEAVR